MNAAYPFVLWGQWLGGGTSCGKPVNLIGSTRLHPPALGRLAPSVERWAARARRASRLGAEVGWGFGRTQPPAFIRTASRAAGSEGDCVGLVASRVRIGRFDVLFSWCLFLKRGLQAAKAQKGGLGFSPHGWRHGLFGQKSISVS